jgi:hypothetical protein
MSWVGFEPTIPVLQRAKTVHALDRAATVVYIIGITSVYLTSYYAYLSQPYEIM